MSKLVLLPDQSDGMIWVDCGSFRKVKKKNSTCEWEDFEWLPPKEVEEKEVL
jgi:hypothetical protein